MERENLIFIGIALGLLVFSHVFLWLLFPRLANLVYKPRSEKGKRSMRKFSNALKWGLFFAIFPIIEPFFFLLLTWITLVKSLSLLCWQSSPSPGSSLSFPMCSGMLFWKISVQTRRTISEKGECSLR